MHFENRLRELAREKPNEEVCGVLSRDPDGQIRVIELPNIHEDPVNCFRMSPEEFLKVKRERNLIGYYHSHPHGNEEASQHDKDVAEAMALPVFIYGAATDTLGAYVPPTFTNPIIGRRFCPLVADCVSLVWDYYRHVLEIDLPFLPRSQADYYRGVRLDIRRILEITGARIVAMPEPHDVISMNLWGSKTANHLAVYIGHGSILHQSGNDLSRIEPWGGEWERSCNHIFRHPAAHGKPIWTPQ